MPLDAPQQRSPLRSHRVQYQTEDDEVALRYVVVATKRCAFLPFKLLPYSIIINWY